MIDYRKLINLIKEEKDKQGLTLEMLATKSGIARGTLNKPRSTRRKHTVNPARQRSVPGPVCRGGYLYPPVARCSSTAMVAPAKREAGSIPKFPGPKDSPRASRFNRTERR